MILVSLISRV